MADIDLNITVSVAADRIVNELVSQSNDKQLSAMTQRLLSNMGSSYVHDVIFQALDIDQLQDLVNWLVNTQGFIPEGYVRDREAA